MIFEQNVTTFTPARTPEARVLIESWRRHYNEVRPHSSLGYLTPGQFINQSTEESDRAVLQ